MAARLTLAALGALLGLAGCATPEPPVYGPIGEAAPYGYRERTNGDGGYALLAVVPPHSSMTEARSFWDRRAQELCPAGAAKQIIFRSERKELMARAAYVYGGAGLSSRATQAFEVEGYLYCRAATER